MWISEIQQPLWSLCFSWLLSDGIQHYPNDISHYYISVKLVFCDLVSEVDTVDANRIFLY